MRIADFDDPFAALEMCSGQLVDGYSIRADDERINTVALELFSEPKRGGGEVGGSAGYSEQQGFHVQIDFVYKWDM